MYSIVAALCLAFWVVSMFIWTFDATHENRDVFTTASIILAIVLLAAFV